MLPRYRRVTTKLFKRVLEQGKNFSSDKLYIKVISEPGQTKLAFSVPKSVEKRALKRNGLRRRGVALLEEVQEALVDGFVGVVFLKKSGNFPSSKEVSLLLEKAGLLKKDS